MDEQAEIGIFGGTGIYDPGLLQDSKEIDIQTPYGKTSDSITLGSYGGRQVTWKDRKNFLQNRIRKGCY